MSLQRRRLGYLCSPSRNRENVKKGRRYPTLWERKSVKEFEREGEVASVVEATCAYLPASGLDLETISHRKYYVQVVNNGVCRGLSYYSFILRLQ